MFVEGCLQGKRLGFVFVGCLEVGHQMDTEACFQGSTYPIQRQSPTYKSTGIPSTIVFSMVVERSRNPFWMSDFGITERNIFQLAPQEIWQEF